MRTLPGPHRPQFTTKPEQQKLQSAEKRKITLPLPLPSTPFCLVPSWSVACVEVDSNTDVQQSFPREPGVCVCVCVLKNKKNNDASSPYGPAPCVCDLRRSKQRDLRHPSRDGLQASVQPDRLRFRVHHPSPGPRLRLLVPLVHRLRPRHVRVQHPVQDQRRAHPCAGAHAEAESADSLPPYAASHTRPHTAAYPETHAASAAAAHAETGADACSDAGAADAADVQGLSGRRRVLQPDRDAARVLPGSDRVLRLRQNGV